ncbi:MAG: helix-turn-helix transcriptional regulator [Clostridia bacterium]|nr:helix-turn-helix transcriptional regulator [Clostridia bacterium]
MRKIELASRTRMEVKFAENLRALRKSKGLTQKELADIVGVDQRTVSAWEHGVCEPSFDMLAKLCEIFSETFDGLLG